MYQKSDDEIDKIINSPVNIDAPMKIFERLAFLNFTYSAV